MNKELSSQDQGNGLLAAAGLAAFWAAIAATLDFELLQTTRYEGLGLHVRYLSTAILMQVAVTLPVGLAAWWLCLIATRRQPSEHRRVLSLISAQVAALLLALSLGVLHWAHTTVLSAISVFSVAGLSVTGGILLAALLLWIVLPRLIARLLYPSVETARRAHRWGSIAGGLFVTVALLTAVVDWSTMMAAPATVRAQPNVLLMSLDSVRKDVWEEYLGHHASNGLEELVASGRRFHNAFTPYSSSLAAHGSMLSGLYPLEHGALGTRLTEETELGFVINPAIELLAERFEIEGYETTGIMTNAWLGPPYGLEAGYQTYVNGGRARRIGVFSPLLATSTSVVGSYLYFVDMKLARLRHAGHPNSRLFRSWLARRDASRPFFCFLHYIDMHIPNDPQPSFATQFSSGPFAGKSGSEMQRLIKSGLISQEEMPAALSHLRDLNLATLAWLDRLVIPVFEDLKDHDLLDNTLVILTSDHGDNLYEKANEYGHSHVYNAATRIPLVVRVPNDSTGLDDYRLVSLVDIPRTIYAYTGVAEPEPLRGIDLLDDSLRTEVHQQMVFLQGWDKQGGHWVYAVCAEGFKLIVFPEGKYELYDLARDPRELKDLADSRPDVVTRLAEAFETARAGMQAASSEMIQVEDLSSELIDQLKALGYIE